MVDIAYLGFDAAQVQYLTDLPVTARRALLQTPFWPFDGLNEKGLVVGMAAVPEQRMPNTVDKPTVSSLLVIRKILDNAANVDEAVAILGRYNIDWDGGPALHYLLADSRQAALVEFFQGEMVVEYNATAWHAATNFLLAAGASRQEKCRRYDAMQQALTTAQGKLNPHQAMRLLSDVSQPNTQWSILYGMMSGEINVVMGRQYDRVHKLRLKTDQ
jgi:predicted choloylglycine hydrolase